MYKGKENEIRKWKTHIVLKVHNEGISISPQKKEEKEHSLYKNHIALFVLVTKAGAECFGGDASPFKNVWQQVSAFSSSLRTS